MKVIQEKDKILKEEKEAPIERTILPQSVLNSITFEEAADRTINYLVDLGQTTDSIDINTVYDYIYRIDGYLYDFFPKKSLISKIDSDKVKQFVSYMFNRPRKDGTGLLSISTVEKCYSALCWIIRYCSEIANPQLLRENCTNDIRFKTLVPKGRGKSKRKDRSHSEEEIKKLIDTLNSKANIRLKAMMNIFIDVGCRPEECIGLKWKNINFETGEVSYEQAITNRITRKYSIKYNINQHGLRSKSLKSIHSYRNNYLTMQTLTFLKNYKSFKTALGIPVSDDDYIFTVWDENKILSPASFEDEYGDFRRKYGFSNIPPYDIRHVVGNLLLESGMSPKDVAQYLGNTPRTLLESYTEIKVDTKQQMKEIVHEKLRSANHKAFPIETIVSILNTKDKVLNRNDYELLDFVANRVVNTDEEYWVIENTKRLILSQYPNFRTFCSDDPEIVNVKLEAYKTFNTSEVDIVQDLYYSNPSIRI